MQVRERIQWHKEADVVVVGFGGAGGVAAITAHDQGIHVVVLEKQPAGSHITNTSMSGGLFVAVNDVPGAVNYMEELYEVGDGLRWTDRDVIQVWAEYSSENADWFRKIGGLAKLLPLEAEHKHIAGYGSIQIYQPGGMGFGLQRCLRQNVESRNIEVMYNAPARKLLTNVKGEVVGVNARMGGKEFNVKASRGVIMAPGGFEFDEEMKLNYLKVYPAYFTGSPANVGDGIKMVQDVGASLWHMNCCSARVVAKYPGFPIAFSLDFGGRRGGLVRWARYAKEGDPCGYIIVDRYGKRYTSEAIKYHTLYYELSLYDSQRLEYPRIPSYWIFDLRRMQAGPLPRVSGGLPGSHRPYTWSEDNREELERGWIVQGDTVRELARKLNMEPATLQETIATFNCYCEHGEDPEFLRPAQHLKPLDRPPFFAVRIWPGGPNTQGGPRRNRKAQILNADGEPVPRLYAAGEFGSIYGMLYPSGGGNIAECIAFGRIAGENVSKEQPMP